MSHTFLGTIVAIDTKPRRYFLNHLEKSSLIPFSNTMTLNLLTLSLNIIYTHGFIHSFNNNKKIIEHLPGYVLGTGDIAVNTTKLMLTLLIFK